jgi:hypothetical protein
VDAAVWLSKYHEGNWILAYVKKHFRDATGQPGPAEWELGAYAAGLALSGDVVPASNFSGKSPITVGTSGAITRGGTKDMGGNVTQPQPTVSLWQSSRSRQEPRG